MFCNLPGPCFAYGTAPNSFRHARMKSWVKLSILSRELQRSVQNLHSPSTKSRLNSQYRWSSVGHSRMMPKSREHLGGF
jgi:hypothetical protein